VRRRCHFFIALLAVALQALDCVVGSLGHSHAHPIAAVAGCDDHATGCSHHHDEAPPLAPSENDEHDDCSLCRHFSQAATPVTLMVEVVGCDHVEAFAPALQSVIAAAPISTHLARGPPASCA